MTDHLAEHNSSPGRAADGRQLGLPECRAYGRLLGARGMAGQPELFQAAARVQDDAALEALLEGFAVEAALVELEATVPAHDPPFYPRELEALHAQKEDILR